MVGSLAGNARDVQEDAHESDRQTPVVSLLCRVMSMGKRVFPGESSTPHPQLIPSHREGDLSSSSLFHSTRSARVRSAIITTGVR